MKSVDFVFCVKVIIHIITTSDRLPVGRMSSSIIRSSYGVFSKSTTVGAACDKGSS